MMSMFFHLISFLVVNCFQYVSNEDIVNEGFVVLFRYF